MDISAFLNARFRNVRSDNLDWTSTRYLESGFQSGH